MRAPTPMAIAAIPPLLDVGQLAKVLHRSVREVGRLRVAGKLPPPVLLRGTNSRPLWRAVDVLDMISRLDTSEGV